MNVKEYRNIRVEKEAKEMFDTLLLELSGHAGYVLNHTETLMKIMSSRTTALKYISELDLSMREKLDEVMKK